MYLVQMLLPLKDNKGKGFPPSKFIKVQHELAEKFGGVTAYVRSPAKGLWGDGKKVTCDDIVILEVMTKKIGKAWWKRYQRILEKAFRQKELVIRAQKMLMIGNK